MFRTIVAESGSTVLFFAADTSVATTKAFTHGGIIFDQQSNTITVAKGPPLPIPSGLELVEGHEITLRLVGPDGTLKPQKRSGVLVHGAHGVLRIAGMCRTPASRTAEDGWTYTSRRYRAYLTHPGVPGSSTLPEWLRESVARQRELWNKMVTHCRTALRQCSDVTPEQIRAFTVGIILPTIDAFNSVQSRRSMIKHPEDLKLEEPSLAAVRKFARRLSVRASKGLPVPEGLEAMILNWAKQHVADYTPIKMFEKDLDRLIKEEADGLKLRFWERRAVANALLAAFTRRRREKLSFSKGWPRFIDSGTLAMSQWGIHYYLNSSTIPGDAVFERRLGSLRLGQPLRPENTGHPNAWGNRFGRRRQFRGAEIAIPDRATGEVWRLAFSIVQHQPIPEGSFLKEWKLVSSGGILHLVLVLQVQNPALAAPGGVEPVAGMDLGWRRAGCGVQVATLFNPVRRDCTSIVVDLESRAPDTGSRPPFRIFMGPSRRGLRRAIAAAAAKEPAVFDTFEGCRDLLRIRSMLREKLKAELAALLGEKAPEWLSRAGHKGLKSILECSGDSGVKLAIREWLVQDTRLAAMHREYSGRIRSRLRKGYEAAAHDVGRMLQADGVRRVAVERNFLAQAARLEEGADARLRSAARYRQWVAPGTFVRTLAQILPSYGIEITCRPARDTTRRCHNCGAINEVRAELLFRCCECGRLLNQDENAAANLAEPATQTQANVLS